MGDGEVVRGGSDRQWEYLPVAHTGMDAWGQMVACRVTAPRIVPRPP